MELQQKEAEHVLGVILDKRDKCLFLNFLIDMTKDCDCFDVRQERIQPDVGIFASRDPVAVDQATPDLTWSASPQPGPNRLAEPGCYGAAGARGEDRPGFPLLPPVSIVSTRGLRGVAPTYPTRGLFKQFLVNNSVFTLTLLGFFHHI